MLVFDSARSDYLRDAIIKIDKEAAVSMREALKARKPDRLKAAVDRVTTVATAMLEKNIRMIKRGHLSAGLVEREWDPFFDSVACSAFADAGLSLTARKGGHWTADLFAAYARSHLQKSASWDEYVGALPGAIRDAIAARNAQARPLTKLEIYRRRCEWSVECLAEKAGYNDVSTVKDHLSGKVKMRVKAAGRYAAAIKAKTGGGLTAEDLMEG